MIDMTAPSAEDIERVARAMVLSWGGDPDTTKTASSASPRPKMWELYAEQARAAIEAMNLDAFAAAAVARERERCAAWCDAAHEQAKSTASIHSSPTEQQKWQQAADDFATAATAIREFPLPYAPPQEQKP